MTKHEIGSEFWDIPVSDTENAFFPSDTSWFLSGRSALRSIVADIKARYDVHTAALPSWCCDSMILPFLEQGIDVTFYPVYMHEGKLKQEPACTKKCDILFLMDYFGYTDRTVADFSHSNIIIRDITHSVFSQKHADADYYFGSLRKWAGFWSGGYARGIGAKTPPPAETYISLRKSAMEAKSAYIHKKSTDKNYLSHFSLAEEMLENYPVSSADPRDILAAKKLDIHTLRKRRRNNARVLLDAFSDIALFPTLCDSDCPLFVPILVPTGKRNALKQHLIQNEIYCPAHWPLTPYHSPDKRTERIYDNELSLICDQRYDENDMERIIKTIRNF